MKGIKICHILNFLDELQVFTEKWDHFRRVCKDLKSPDVDWKSDFGRHFIKKYAEVKNQIAKRCPEHGYSDCSDDEDTDMEDKETAEDVDDDVNENLDDDAMGSGDEDDVNDDTNDDAMGSGVEDDVDDDDNEGDDEEEDNDDDQSEEDDGEDVVEDDDETDGGYDDEDDGKDDDQDDDDDMDEEYEVDGVGECCWESLLWPMEDFYEEKEFKKLVQKEDDEWESLHDRFNSPFVHLKSIQPMLKKIFKENSFVDLPSMYIKLIVNLLKHYTHYTGRDDQELEDYFKYSFDKLTDSSVPLNQKRTMLQKSRLKKKMIEFLKKNYSENEQ